MRKHVQETTGEDHDYLNAGNFKTNQHVHLRFPDGSFALFRYAFHLLDPGGGEIAVFTEHCGYHFFPLGGLQVERLESIWTDAHADTEDDN